MTKDVVITATIFDKRGKQLSQAKNTYTKSHPRMVELSKKCGGYIKQFLHAEVLAIIRASKNGTPHKIKIERYFKDGSPAMAAPCPVCMMAIREADIRSVEYTVS